MNTPSELSPSAASSPSFITVSESSKSHSPCPSSIKINKSRKSMLPEVDKDLRPEVINWVERVLLPIHPKPIYGCPARLERDFADGCLVAELIAQIHPKLVEMHNYTKGLSSAVKRQNWMHLRRKVLSKLGMPPVSDELMEMIIECKPGAVDRILKCIYDDAMKIEEQKREAEEELNRGKSDLAPAEDWKQDVCYVRKDAKGKLEIMVFGKLMIDKEQANCDIQTRENELKMLRTTYDQLRSQVARLQMTVDLKEGRLGELTHQLSLYQRNNPNTPIASEEQQKSNENVGGTLVQALQMHYGGHGDSPSGAHVRPNTRKFI